MIKSIPPVYKTGGFCFTTIILSHILFLFASHLPNRMNPLILLVDNDPEFTYLIERYSRTIQWSVVHANDAQGALALIHTHQPAMIMLNLLLPPHGGWDVLHEIRKSSAASNIPITVYSSIPDEERAWGEGADFCLWKPIMLEEFIAALEAAHLYQPNSPGR